MGNKKTAVVVFVPCSMCHVSCSMNKGFTLVEIIIYLAILSLVLLLIASVVFYFYNTNKQTTGDREALENARRVLQEITYEINGAKSIYTPTTTSSQLSLQTERYLPAGETDGYIDFFVCGTRICLKKESQSAIFFTSDTVQVDSLVFNQIASNFNTSIKATITLHYKNSTQSVTVTSTASLRNY